MKDLIIGFDKNSEQQNKYRAKRKNLLFEQAKNLVSEFIDIKNEEDFKNSFSNYAKNEITKSIGIKNIKLENISSVPFHKIREIEIEYNKILIDKNTDFNIYATNPKQVAEYKTLLNICTILNEKKLELNSIVKGFKSMLLQENGMLVPNHHYIKLQ